jgi:hypothetical protein
VEPVLVEPVVVDAVVDGASDTLSSLLHAASPAPSATAIPSAALRRPQR